MKKILLALLCLFVAGCNSAHKNQNPDILYPANLSNMSADEVEEAMIKGHPANYFTLATKLFAEGEKQEAVKWFYVGQIRYRAYLKANPSLKPSGDPALFSGLLETVGRPLNEYIGGDIDEYVATIDEAIQWHNEHPYDFVDKDQNKDIYATQLAGLEKMKKYIIDNKDELRKRRAENGLENR